MTLRPAEEVARESHLATYICTPNGWKKGAEIIRADRAAVLRWAAKQINTETIPTSYAPAIEWVRIMLDAYAHRQEMESPDA